MSTTTKAQIAELNKRIKSLKSQLPYETGEHKDDLLETIEYLTSQLNELRSKSTPTVVPC